MSEAGTIVAPATPMGVSALAVVRVSGPKARLVGETLLHPFKAKPGLMYRSFAKDPQDQSLIDDLMVCFFAGPKSYSGEDSIEFYTHGNPLIVRHLMRAILSIPGLRLAEPGEFTRRSFQNGKIDLVQAEAVGDLLHATEERGLRNAQKLLEGRLSGDIQQIAEQVKHMAAILELEVDFVEDETDIDQSDWMPRLNAIEQSLVTLTKKFRSRETLGKVPRVVVYGAPNAGKSSLVNALLREDRILVSAIAGTTRDAVQVRLLLSGGEVELIDTAGLSENPSDMLDAMSQKKTQEMLLNTEHAMLVVDSSQELDPSTHHMIQEAHLHGHMVVWSKTDLLEESKRSVNNSNVGFAKASGLSIRISSTLGEGLAELMTLLNQMLFPCIESTDDYWIASERQMRDVEMALDALHRTQEALLTHPKSPEVLAFEFQGVRKALRQLIGEISANDVLNALFSGFCIGK